MLGTKTFPYATHDRKILINNDYGSFGFSDAFIKHVRDQAGLNIGDHPENYRANPIVVAFAQKFGIDEAGGSSYLILHHIPAYMSYQIMDYDGLEDVVHIFPWKEMALALYTNNQDDPILKALENGIIALPDDY